MLFSSYYIKMPPKAQKKEAPKKTDKKAEKKPDPKPAAPAPAVDAEAPSDDIDYTAILTNLIQIEKLVRTTMPLLKKLQKKHEKDLKNASKAKKTKRARDPNAPPSGFARPGPVSKELRTFLGMKDDELIARTQVAKRISEYIKEHHLKNPDNNREIIVDKKLATLFKLPDKSKVAFFQIQSHLSKNGHFIKATKA